MNGTTGPSSSPVRPVCPSPGVRLIIPDHALGLPVLRALSLCTCCRHYPGAAAGRIPRSSHPAVSAFPGWGTGSACTSSFSRSHDVLWVAIDSASNEDRYRPFLELTMNVGADKSEP